MLRYFNRLQVRIFAFFVILLLLVQAVTLWLAYRSNQQLEQQQLSRTLSEAEWVFRSEYDNRHYYLSAFAETAAKDFALKEIFIDGDTRSFLVALNNHRKRIDAQMAMAVNHDGEIIAQLQVSRNDAEEKVSLGGEMGQRFQFLLTPDSHDFLYSLNDKIYQLRFAPLTSGGDSNIGWVGFGYPIDNQLAQTLQRLTGLKAGFVAQSDDGNVNFIAGTDAGLSDSDKRVLTQYFNGANTSADYLIWSEALGKMGNQTIRGFMYRPSSDVLGALQSQWLQQLIFLLVMLPLSMLVAYLIAASVTKPINRLIEQAKFIALGNYHSTVSVGNSEEMQSLAREFTLMQQAVLSREQKILHQAGHDPLTNMPNRNELERVTAPWFAENAQIALCVLKLRRLADVNLTLGHEVGDEVLKEVGRRLASLPDVDIACHLSGDEYLLGFKHLSEASFKAWLPGLTQVMDRDYGCKGIRLHLQLTMGLSFYQPGADLVSMLRQADTAMRQAKQKKLDYCIYDPDDDKNTLERLQLVNELKSAIEEQQLVLWYQPKMTLQTGKVSHVEALVRWQHPVRGMIPPDVFIPIAEKTGQMNSLTHWVLQQAVHQYQFWRLRGIELAIAVNISAENLKDDGFCDMVIELVNCGEMPVEQLTLEITEDAVVADPQQAIAQLTRLRQYGFKLSIDDYGTGYSSLAQLKQLPVDELKIDRSFVQHLMSQPDDQTIVRSTIQMAHNLGLTVVAEGIEDQQSLHWLAQEGCEKGQGYYLSRPVDGVQLMSWLQANDDELKAQG